MNTRISGRWKHVTPVRIVGVALTVAVSGATVAAAAPVSASSGDRAKPHATAPLPAPPQMKALDALLGKWKCTITDPPPQPGKETVSYVTTRKALNGHYLYSDVVLNPGNLHGRQVFGWNPVDQNYVRFSYDDWGTSDTSTSPALKDGHLVFSGEVIAVSAPSSTGQAPGAHMKLQDDYTLVRPGYRTVSTTVTLATGQTSKFSGPCTRI
jgi:hypothetical protein